MSLLIDDKTKERQDLQCYTQSVKTVQMKTDVPKKRIQKIFEDVRVMINEKNRSRQRRLWIFL